MIKSKQELKKAQLFYLDQDYFSIRFNLKEVVVYNNNFNECFRFEGDKMPNVPLIRTPENEFICYYESASNFFKNGLLSKQENGKFYYTVNNFFKSYCYADEVDKLYLETSQSKFLVNNLIGETFFIKDVFIQEVANKNLMIATSLLDGSELWRLDYNKMIDAENVYGGTFVNFGNKIYLILSSSVKRGLFCIDAKTGKVVDFIPNVYYFLLKDSQNIYVTKEHDIVCKINPETHAMEDWDVRELMKDNGFDGIGDQRSVAMDGIIYLTQTFGAKNAKLGILDINSKELLWKYDFAPECGAVGGIQVSKERIFVHTQDNTLHIFEKA
jgi:outer membrane protein assembly factor BamB